ncbi:adenylosuccinate lyase [Patescibacteria group bacterium]|nr:adenylosuccinate lyase [Patescibacteria group bacterium]
MIERYTPKKIGRIWTLGMKFKMWLVVELAVIKARVNLGDYPEEKYLRIRKAAKFTVRAVEARDREIEHDLQAFVDIVRQSLPTELRADFHQRITSYDTEDPAQALLMLKAMDIILQDLDVLIERLTHIAGRHMWTYCMGVTHGQDGRVITYAGRLCVYLDGLRQSRQMLVSIRDQLSMTKCSGAMGNYGSISPELESEVLNILKLKVRPAASQIVLRDSIARFLSEIAILGGVLEKIALDNFILGQTAYREVIEPRKKKQKGSSAMPHKKNTILNERERGMPRVLRGNTIAALENIATPLERDISQSSVERIILPDSTILIDYMLQLMTKIISGMEVNRDQMALGINRTYGCWASEEVKSVLCDELCGKKTPYTPEDVYYFVQACAFTAMEKREQLTIILQQSLFPRTDAVDSNLLSKLIIHGTLDKCFDFKTSLINNMPAVYERNGLNNTLAMDPNC